MTKSRHEAGEVVAFWIEAGPQKWFSRDDAFDAQVRDRYRVLHDAAAQGALSDWERDPQSALALLLLLDQFPRNMFRGETRAFATDPMAREFAARAVEKGFDRAYAPELRAFFYLPFMHSERLEDQERCVALCQPLAEETVRFAEIHRDIIARFGRFPHRNAIFGRETTDEEARYLASPDAFKG